MKKLLALALPVAGVVLALWASARITPLEASLLCLWGVTLWLARDQHRLAQAASAETQRLSARIDEIERSSDADVARWDALASIKFDDEKESAASAVVGPGR